MIVTPFCPRPPPMLKLVRPVEHLHRLIVVPHTLKRKSSRLIRSRSISAAPTKTGAIADLTRRCGQGEELRPAVPVQQGSSWAQAAAASILTPVSPLSPKAKPSAYFGSSSTETTFSPNSRCGIGAPEAGYELLGLHAHGVRVGFGEGHLLRHDRLEANPEVLLLRDTVGILGYEPEHALGAAIAA